MTLDQARFPGAVLFDLDDTISDHQYARRSALAALQHAYPELAGQTIRSLESAHERHLQATHDLLLAGRLTAKESRWERLRLFFADYGVSLSEAQAGKAETQYRQAYDAVRRPVPGVVALIDALRARSAKIGIVSNGLLFEQEEKLRLCGLKGKTDAIVTADQQGLKKPHKAIFEHALNVLGVKPTEAVMIGDSWQHDVLGARNAGIAAIWFNRYDEPFPESSACVRVITITRLEPIEMTLNLLAI